MLGRIDYRKLAASIAAVGMLFWLYTFYAIAHVPPGDGTGLQWLAVIPLGAIFGLFFLPSSCDRPAAEIRRLEPVLRTK